MNDIQKRFLLFLGGCISTRAAFAYYAKVGPLSHLRILGYLALIPAFGFLYIWFNNLRQTGAEVLGAKIWWNNLRPIHAIIYLIFAYNAIYMNPSSWIVLAFDVILGLFSFLAFHYSQGDFVRLLDGSRL